MGMFDTVAVDEKCFTCRKCGEQFEKLQTKALFCENRVYTLGRLFTALWDNNFAGAQVYNICPKCGTMSHFYITAPNVERDD